MNIELHFIDKNGVDQGLLPDTQSVNVSPVFNDYGTVDFVYPRTGIKWSLMDGLDEFDVAVYINGVHHPELDARVKDISGDDIDETGLYQYAGNMTLQLLDEGVVYPKNWPTYDPKAPTHVISNWTAGQYMGYFINLAQARGACLGVTWNSFSPAVDSNGQAWTKQISLEIKPGVSLAGLLQSLQANGLCDFRMVGKDLRLYNPDTLVTDRTLQNPPLTFRKGRDLRDSPRKVSSRDVQTVVLGAGKDDAGVYAEQVNATAVAARRRIEGYVSNGNITDPGTMTAWLQLQLQKTSQAKMEKTNGLEFADPDSPQPVRDFDIGDWAYIEVRGVLERYRIKQWVLSKDSGGKISGSVSMNDLFAEASEALSKRIDGILGGTTVTGESRAVDTIPGAVYDNLGPAVPTGLALSSNPYGDKSGTTYAYIEASWVAVTTNADGSPMNDLAGYRIAWRYANIGAATDWRFITMNNDTFMSWSPVSADEDVIVKIQAYDKYGNPSLWSAEQLIHTGTDTIAPEKPSTPVMDNYMGLARAFWNGNTFSGAAWPKDFQYVEVHFSSVNNFTPTYGPSGTLSDQLTSGGYSFAKGVYGNNIYCRLVAVDSSGNKSLPSNVAFIAPTQVVSSDIFAGAVGTAQLADLAVTTAKINNLAVNTAQIGSMDAGKIATGTLSAAVIISGRIATALTGQRTEQNAVGFQGFDASGNLTLSLDGANNLMAGTFKTALTGRRIEIQSSGTKGKIDFIGPSGQIGQIIGFTDDVSFYSSEAIALSYPISATSSSWNSISVSSGEEAYMISGYASIRIGGNGSGSKGFDLQWLSGRGSPSSVLPSGVSRFQVNSTSTIMTGTGGSQVSAAGSGTCVFLTSNGYTVLQGGGSGSTQTCVYFLYNSAGTMGGYFYGIGNPVEFQFVIGSGATYAPIRASAFNVGSDEASKKSVRKFSDSPRGLVRQMDAHTYLLRKGDGRRRMGYIAQHAPDCVRVPAMGDDVNHEAIDLYGLTTLGIEYTKEVDDELAQLRAEVAELRELVTK